MQTPKHTQLWRVEWNHRSGYQAPYQLIAAETIKIAHQKAKYSSRLADFPKVWSYKLFAIVEDKEKRKKLSQEVS